MGVTINQCHAVNIATRGYISNDAGYIATVGRLWFTKLLWREFIYITFTSAAINTQIDLISSINTQIDLTSSINTQIDLTSSINTQIDLTSSINKQINITTTIISDYNVF